MSFRIGFGYDVHAFSFDRKLIMGGIEIPFEKGLRGHSDADVLCHSITDALLGSLALGDIGTHFPDTDPEYKDADSIGLLKKSYMLVQQNNFTLVNIDATIIAERPKFLPYIQQISQNIAKALSVRNNQVSIKATTNEELGFLGRGEGIASQAVVLVREL